MWRRLIRAAPARLGSAAAAAVLAVGAAGLVPPPAHAAVPDTFGFALWTGATAPVPYRWPPATAVIPGGPGIYQVIFPGQASPGGVTHVTALNTGGPPRWCQVRWFAPVGANEVVQVGCYALGGVLAPSGFTVHFASSSGAVAGGHYAYVHADFAGVIVSDYTTGLFNAVNHPAVGIYEVRLNGVATPGPNDGSLQVTAVNPGIGVVCKPARWASAPAAHQGIVVHCFDSAGLPADTGWNLTYQYQRALYGSPPPANFGYGWQFGPPPTQFDSAPGGVVIWPAPPPEVVFTLVAQTPDDVQVTPYGWSRDFCLLRAVWTVVATHVQVPRVDCYDMAGVLVGPRFFVSYNSAF